MAPVRSTLILCFILFSSLAVADKTTQIIAFQCYSCHGERLEDIKSAQPFSKPELAQILLSYKYENRIGTIMNRISKGFTDYELKSVADYLGKQK